ncbi:MAG TPA: hypothetical protein VKC34_02505, partial [Blastocatellia bacterium]|nr:hypothetical protein [Blastocatellia bacterium]
MKTYAPSPVNGFIKTLSAFAGLAVLISIQSLSMLTPSTTRAQSTSVRVESFPLRPEGEVRVENSRGATRIEVWSNSSVRIVAEKSPAGKGLAQSEIVMMSAQNTVIVQCREGARDGRIDLMIYVPRRSRVQLTGGAWPVEISGSLSSAVIETTGGKIDYRVPPSDSARIIMQSTRGAVRSTLPIEVSERNGTRSLQGKLGTGASPLILTSQSGNITLGRAASDPVVAQAGSAEAYHEPTSRATEEPDAQDRTTAPASLPDARGRSQGISAGATIGSSSQSTGARQESGAGRIQEEESASNQAMGARIDLPSNGGGRASRSSGGSVLLSQNSTSDEESLSQTGGPFARPRHEKRESAGSTGMSVRIIPADRPLGYDPNSSEPVQGPSGVADQRSSARRKKSGSQTDYNWPTDDQNGAVTAGQPAGPTQGRRGDDARNRMKADEPPLDQTIARATRPGRPVLRTPDEMRQPSEAGAERSAENYGSANEDTITLEASLVNLNVMVTNRSGLGLQDLRKEDITVSENGVRQEVDFFKPSTAPFNLVLVLDLSGSIMDKLDVIKSGALKFLDVIGPQDKVAVVTFTDKVRIVSPLTS